MASNFAIAFRVLPPDRREAIEAVYAFCRRADDAADDAVDAATGRAALARVRLSLDDAFAGANTGAEASLSLAISRFALPRRPFEDLLEGVSWDLEGRRYSDRQDLRAYAYRVASTVGLLCVRIFGCEAGACDRYAEELGIALQWTNILRDVRRDLALGRVYLPAASMREHGVTEEDLARPDARSRPRLSALVRAEAAFARERFAAAAGALPASERRRVLSGEIMAAVYRALLARIESLGDRVIDRPVRLSATRRLWIAGRVVLRERFAGPAGA